jgi:hypothetical protein
MIGFRTAAFPEVAPEMVTIHVGSLDNPDLFEAQIGLVANLCRSKCSFKPLGVRRPMGFSLPMLNVGGVGYRSR